MTLNCGQSSRKLQAVVKPNCSADQTIVSRQFSTYAALHDVILVILAAVAAAGGHAVTIYTFSCNTIK